MEDYVDIRSVHPEYWMVQCWNCGHEWFAATVSQARVCHGCLMGQEELDHESESVTPEGYMDYGRLWYGDIPRREMVERFERTKEDARNGGPSSRGHVDLPGDAFRAVAPVFAGDAE